MKILRVIAVVITAVITVAESIEKISESSS